MAPDPLVEWAVYYVFEDPARTARFTNLDGLPSEAPTTNVIVTNQKTENGRDTERFSGSDNYLWIDATQQWTPASDFNVQVRENDGTAFSARLYGFYTVRSLYLAVLHQSEVDEDFPNALDRDSYSLEQLQRFNRHVDLTREALEAERQAELDERLGRGR